MYDFMEVVNPRIFDIPDYDQGHVTACWENKDIHRLMSNESSYRPLLPVIEAMQEIAGETNYYAEDPTYAYELRGQLADYASVEVENITLGNGSIELLDILFQVLMVNPGIDHCLLPQPDYSAYIPRLKFFGWVHEEVPCVGEYSNFASILLNRITPNTKFIILSRPNNPLGAMISKADIELLLDSGLIVIVDEAYIELAEENASVSSWVRERENLIVTRTFSKGFCLAGIRLGYLIAHPDIIRYINRSKHIFNVNLAAMAAGKATMKHLEEYQKRFTKIAETRDRITESIKKIAGLSAIKSFGNFILVNSSQTGIEASCFVDMLLSHEYYVRDFSSKPGLDPNSYFRISVGKEEEMNELVSILKSFVNSKA